MPWHGGIHRFHPYKNPEKRRIGRPRKFHFTKSIEVHSMSDQVMDSQGGAPQHKKQKTQEARMVPGLGPQQFGFPNSVITTLRYSDTINMSSLVGVRSIHVFAANGIFDPDITATGHQPMYRDAWAAIYDQYVVIGAKITVHWSTGTTGMPALCGIVGDDDSVISTDTRVLREQNNSVYGVCSAVGGPGLTQSLTFGPLEDIGVDAKADGSSQTSVAANPSELWCFGIWAVAHDVGSTVDVRAAVSIEYTVKFSELQTPSIN